MEKQETIAQTMRAFMESGPKVADYPNYKSLNDAVGKLHNLPAGKCQALAGPKAWAWAPDSDTGVWRKSTEAEVEAKRTAAAGKAHGGPRSKVLSDADREALEAQIEALVVVGNPALKPLLADLLAQRNADDAARKGSLKGRLAKAIDALGLQAAVDALEARVAESPAETDA